jgi:adenosylcobinamide amidohydrolase
MKALELLQENPHAAKVIKEYYNKVMLSRVDESGLPEHYIEFLKDQGLDDENVAQMMEANARNVYDVLDDNGFVISILYDAEFKKFSWYVNDDQHKIVCNTRKEAENEAVAACIFRLERKLNPQPDEEN